MIDVVERIQDLIKSRGGHSYLVGGCVRDRFLGKVESKDYDLEVYKIPLDDLVALLSSEFSIDLVGQSFGCIKILGTNVDVSLPRTESKCGITHKEFHIHTDHHMTPEQAVQRRDFTINGLMMNEEGKYEDHCGAIADLNDRVLRVINPEKFGEDPLRVLRGMQFIARFNLLVTNRTYQICRGITQEGLTASRIFEEWKKLILLGNHMQKALEFLKDTWWINYYPELKATIFSPQDVEWHPEGDVFTHTTLCLDRFAELRDHCQWSEEETLIIGFAVLCHDFGKPKVCSFSGGRWHNYEHEAAGVEPTESFLNRMNERWHLIEQITPLVKYHLAPREFHVQKVSNSAVRRLANKVTRLDRLVNVAKCDTKGNRKVEFDPEFAQWLLAKATELDVTDHKPQPIVMGRHLLELGYQPGPEMGKILSKLFEKQLDGYFTTVEEGIKFIT